MEQIKQLEAKKAKMIQQSKEEEFAVNCELKKLRSSLQ
jgi:hypothetical protein